MAQGETLACRACSGLIWCLDTTEESITTTDPDSVIYACVTCGIRIRSIDRDGAEMWVFMSEPA